ncbi:medium-chain fatty-acid--CoA ligase [Gordonibacter massiliensis (ex Traore et al. 2017)]|uniref:Medium-chain fatty-acid--CoA ligase n=1 Tax=Gordonibacter massiliensis (ex Traore et al. 2017) TaxID=1841863 RepID=A0A842JBW1_9ACTN|nr:medium-chain fatty-acid--CoA ligase [Gordonibacter massiliensis (ex Traore et al. 2017)]MBC2889197.1 medium-chain fatty-acid--CoA ligase [Gordonibacter massiliensis (ex Traore et al. 2017)]
MITDLKINEERKRLYYERGYWGVETLGDVWNRQAKACADREYVVDDRGHRYTYAYVDDAAGRLASWLADVGVEEGEVVSFQMPVWAEFCIVYVACLKLGAVMHPLSRAFNERDLRFALNQVGSAAFVCPATSRNCRYDTQIAAVLADVPSIKGVAVFDRDKPATAPFPLVERILEEYEPLSKRPALTTSDHVALILSTSGTTGKPKAVLLTHNNLIYSERAFTSELELTADDVMFMPAPLNHATGFNHGLIAPLLLGGKAVLQEKFDASAAIDLMNAEGATWSMGATPFIYDLLACIDATGKRPEKLRFYLCGGAPVPGSMVRRAREQGIVLCEVYGSTESCPHVFVPPAYALGWNGAFSGRPFKGVEVRVVDERGRDVAPGVQGEELSRGPNVFVGYLGNPEATESTLSDDGWFASGDLCSMDERGRIRINGRKKEIIIRGGENISAVEVDEAVTGCPGIGDHATIGVPDARLGERICLFAVPTGDARPGVAEVAAHLKGKNVQKRLWPERVEYIDAVPRTESGKVRRNQLFDELALRLAGAAGARTGAATAAGGKEQTDAPDNCPEGAAL